MRTRLLARGLVVGATLAATGVTGGRAAHGAGGYSVSAPYTDGSQYATASCRWPDVSPRCATWGDARPASGVMHAGAYTDSGASGTLPGTGESTSLSRIDQAVDLHGWSHAVVVLHLHVGSVTTSSTGLGRSYVYVAAECRTCPDESPYQFVGGNQDVELQLSVDGEQADPVVVETLLQVITRVDCDQVFCLAPTGTARAAGSATLDRIEVIPR